MSTGTLKIHSENILPIIKKWLYSDKDIFIRELISNACDAIQKVKILHEQGVAQALDEEFRIEIKADPEKRTLKFIDTGIGMDAEEIEKYITELAFSGAEEFLEKYSSNEEKDQIIGHFGLGFYSAYMVAEKVEINTLSYKKEAEPVLWSCDGASEYQMEKGSRSSRGTEITLYVSEEEKDFLESSALKSILDRYCSFLPYPIYLNDTHINKNEPLWMKQASDCTDKDYLEFYRTLYPMEPDPLFWVHLNVDYPFHLKGILYFPKISPNFDFKKQSVRLFCNRVFVSENCQDLLPEYLTMLRGAIDSPDIPLNVSRSCLQMDKTVRQLGMHISKKVSDRLNHFYKEDREKFIQFWNDIEVIIKLGAIQNDKFYSRVKDFIIWKNANEEWTTIEEYLERNKEKHENKIYYTIEEKHFSDFLELYKQRNIEVLYTSSAVDIHLMSFLEGKLSPAKFQRIDSSVEENILDKSKEQTLLDADGKTPAGKLAEFIKGKLNIRDLEVEAKSLANNSLPAFIVLDEQSRRMRDFFQSTSAKMQDFSSQEMMGKRTFIVNTNNSLISSLQELNQKDPNLVKELITNIYELSLLSQKEMPPESLSNFITRNNSVLEKLTNVAINKESA